MDIACTNWYIGVMKVEHELELSASPQRLWELTLDIERWPEITPTIKEVTRLDEGPLRVGSRARLRQPGQRAKVWTVTTLDTERCFAWAASLAGSTVTGIHELEPTAQGVRSTLRVTLEGRTAWLVGPLLRPAVARAIAKENAAFQEAAEASTLPS